MKGTMAESWTITSAGFRAQAWVLMRSWVEERDGDGGVVVGRMERGWLGASCQAARWVVVDIGEIFVVERGEMGWWLGEPGWLKYGKVDTFLRIWRR